jgi:hypothetical protein
MAVDVPALRNYRGPLYELADEYPLGAQRLASWGVWPEQNGEPSSLAHVTIASGEPGEGPWLNVTTTMRAPARFRPQQRARFHLSFALFIEDVVHRGADADSRDGSELRWKAANSASAISDHVSVDGRRVISSRVEAEMISADADERPVLFAESVAVPEIELVVWGHASVWPWRLRTVPDLSRYLSS